MKIILFAVVLFLFIAIPAYCGNAEADSLLIQHLSARTVTTETIQADLAGGANPKSVNKDGIPALALAAVRTEQPEILQMILKAGVDAKGHHSQADLALIVAAHNQNGLAFCKMLVAAGANPNFQLPSGTTALFFPAKNGTNDIVAFLVASGADPSLFDKEKRENAYSLALRRSTYSDTNTLAELLKSGKGINAKNMNGETLLDLAIRENSVELITIVLAAKPDLKAPDQYGRTPLMNYLLTPDGADIQVLKLMLAGGADIHAVDPEGDPVLFYAAKGESFAAVKLITAMVGDPYYLNSSGQDAANVARQAHNEEAASFLEQKIAQSPTTQLWKAVEAGDAAAIDKAIKTGADIVSRDEFGHTPLIVAVSKYKPDVVRALLKVKQDVELTDATSLTAMHYAQEMHSDDIIAMLKAAGAKK